MLLQGGTAPATGHWFANSIFAKALHPADRRTSTDLELFGRLTSRSSGFNKVNYAYSQLTRIRSAHCPALPRINALDSLLRGPWECSAPWHAAGRSEYGEPRRVAAHKSCRAG